MQKYWGLNDVIYIYVYPYPYIYNYKIYHIYIYIYICMYACMYVYNNTYIFTQTHPASSGVVLLAAATMQDSILRSLVEAMGFNCEVSM